MSQGLGLRVFTTLGQTDSPESYKDFEVPVEKAQFPRPFSKLQVGRRSQLLQEFLLGGAETGMEMTTSPGDRRTGGPDVHSSVCLATLLSLRLKRNPGVHPLEICPDLS